MCTDNYKCAPQLVICAVGAHSEIPVWTTGIVLCQPVYVHYEPGIRVGALWFINPVNLARPETVT